jgi:hypothetical protein
MTAFSMELYKQKQEETGYDPVALRTLELLKEKTKMKNHLFETTENSDFEKYKKIYAKEYAILENQLAYEDFSEDQKQQIRNDFINERINKQLGN